MAKKPLAETQKFKDDWREKNPCLHLLYVKNAVEHLSIANAAIKRFYACSNVHSTELGWALQKEVARLCKENAAYADAVEIIEATKVRIRG